MRIAEKKSRGRKYQAGVRAARSTSELEKLYITTHYYDIVTGEIDKSIETYELWRRTYPQDSIPPTIWQLYTGRSESTRSPGRALETMRLAPNAALSYQVLGRAYFALGRVAEAKAIRLRQIDLKLAHRDHRVFTLAFMEGDGPGCNVSWTGQKASPMSSSCSKPR